MNKSNRKNTLAFLMLMLIALQTSSAQSLVRGKVLNETGEPIPFVSIGIKETFVGTISEVNGDFELKIPAAFIEKRISFSSIGYESTSIAISEHLNGSVEVILKEDVRRLSEVIVESRKHKKKDTKVKRTGKVYRLDGRFMADAYYSGSAMAQKVVSPFDTTNIQWVDLGYLNKIEDLQMRIKFQAVDEKGRPGKLLIDKKIIVNLYEFDGSHKMRFDDFLYVTEKEFFIVFEPLVLMENRNELFSKMQKALKRTPELIKFNERGEMIIDNNEIDINFLQFKVSTKLQGTTFYRASAFDKWRESEELSMIAGLSDVNEDLGFTVARVETEFEKNATTVDVYEHKVDFSYSTLADYLRKVAGLRVEGKGYGEEIKVWVRGGVSSMLYSNQPIFVIDGVNVGRGYINTNGLSPTQIVSVEVLRGPVQTALWGEDGNNGVVVIKTINAPKKSTRIKRSDSD